MLGHPLALLPLLEQSDALASAAAMSLLLQSIAVFGAAVLLKLAWRLGRAPALGWLAVALVVASFGSYSFLLLQVRQVGPVSARAASLLQLLITALLVAVLAQALARHRPHPPRMNPVLLGSLLAAAAVVVTALAAGPGPVPSSLAMLDRLPARAVLASDALLVLTALVVVGRVPSLPGWSRVGLASALGLVSAARLALPGSPPGHLRDALLGLAGAAILSTTALAALRSALRDSAARLGTIAQQTTLAAEAARLDHVHLHEVNATIAGVAAASRLMTQPETLSPAQRRRLDSMLESEVGRLERLIRHEHRLALEVLDLDQVIEPLTVSQELQAHHVSWCPSRVRAIGRGDDLAEVLVALLDNARQHAPLAPAWIQVEEHGQWVEIRVVDLGPGVPEPLAARIFDSGVSRTGSRGRGLGLAVARELTESMGGQLRFAVAEHGRGAVFTVSLLAAAVEAPRRRVVPGGVLPAGAERGDRSGRTPLPEQDLRLGRGAGG